MQVKYYTTLFWLSFHMVHLPLLCYLVWANISLSHREKEDRERWKGGAIVVVP